MFLRLQYRGLQVYFLDSLRAFFRGDIHDSRTVTARLFCGCWTWNLVGNARPVNVTDLGLSPKVFADELESTLRFGDLESLVCELQETHVARLQSTLATKLRGGLPLKTPVAAGALANARTFGGEDDIGFHTFMALGAALKMSALMPKGSEALPVFKVLYRNRNQIPEFGGGESETLHAYP